MQKVSNKFKHSSIGTFFQAVPRLQNPWLADGFLQRVLQRYLPKEAFSEAAGDLERFGRRIVVELEPLAEQCEAQPPTLVHLDAWGRRVDKILTCDAWKRMKAVSAEEGLIAIPYENHYGEWSRLVQFSKLYLYHPSSGLYTCPLAMTDGAAKTIKELNLTQLKEAYNRLTTRSPEQFWTSGQWMTERRGGSDVGTGTETIAIPTDHGKYKLHGYKWFSSATDSDVTFTLGRIAGANGEILEGSSGLSMFFVRTFLPSGSLNNIQVMKLKNKLGTRQLPTAELLLDGTEAELASQPGRGVAAISNMLTVTRIHNASASVSAMRRILSLARDYSRRREAFGRKISEFPLHVETLANLEIEARAGTILFLEVARLLGAVETGNGTQEDELLLRLLTPIVKLYTGKKCIGVVSEGLESFGGQGYIEDTGIPKILRDCQVTPIWEGTTNILSLDVLRALLKSKGEALGALQKNLTRRLDQIEKQALGPGKEEIFKLRGSLAEIAEIATNTPELLERGAREFAFGIGHVTIGTLLLEHAVESKNSSDKTTALRFIHRIPSLTDALRAQNEVKVGGGVVESRELVYDSYKEDLEA